MSAARRLTDPLEAGAALDAAAPALIEDGRVLSHQDLLVQVDALASLLQRWLSPGDRSATGRIGPRVGVCALNSMRHVIAVLAIFRAGAVWVPINPHHGPEINRTLIRQADLDLLLIEADCAPAVGTGSVSALLIDEGGELDRHLNRALGDRPGMVPEGAEDIVCIRFVGIPEGRFRGILLPARCFLGVQLTLERLFAPVAADLSLLAAPLSEDAVHFVLPVLGAGGAHRLLRHAGPAGILDALRQEVTLAYLPPALVPLLLGEGDFAPSDFPALRHLACGAGGLPPGLAARARERFGPRLSTLFGLPEAPLTVAALGGAEMGETGPGASVGPPCEGSRIALLEPDGVLRQEPGAVGEVVVAGDLVMAGYLNAPVETDAAFHEGWLRTGEVGALDARGHLMLGERAVSTAATTDDGWPADRRRHTLNA
ncbi:class I adenylate-forming enzyme family protein [Rhodocista pekingensis]|uniref:Class I adenylate-forming enzyme family protein n=1 Tax=Rhodocista pekingensis TaxID=201185 RepID=A0ABW2KYP5_9PROT